MNRRLQNILARLTGEEKSRIAEEQRRAYDFDPRDPLFGLSKDEISGPKLSRRSFLRLVAASGGSLSLSHLMGAAGIALPAATRAFAQGGGHLICGWAGTAEITTLDPAQINQVLQFQVASNVLSGLTHINADLVAEGDLATDWTVSDDGLVWTFNLREGVTWHNGDAFTAADVVFTYNRSKDPAQSIHSGNLVNVLDVVALDDMTIQLSLGKPQASLLVKTLERSSGRAMTIVNSRAIEAMGLQDYGLMPVGTGPFRVTEHQLGQGVVLERFDEYYDPARPVVDKVTIIPIPENEPLAAAIETGDIHLIGGNGVAAELVDRFLMNPDLVVDEIPGNGFQSVFVNPWREPMAVEDFNLSVDELKQQNGFKVRLALAKAFDRERFIQRALFGRGVPAFGTINPAMGYYFDTAINETSQQSFDVEAAQALLADAGYPGGEGFPALKLLTTPAGRRQAEVIVDMYRYKLSIDSALDIQAFTLLLGDAYRMENAMLRLCSCADFDPDDGLVDWMLSNSRFNGANRNDADLVEKYGERAFGFFSADRVDELINEQAVTADPAARKALVQEANQLTSDKLASIFIFHGTEILVHRAEVTYPPESRIVGLRDLDRVSLS
ncbi:MAG: ABC transporter substrate-binding protein [Chloroflexi bacterium]|nr:ABC transporter substrate-binding protein [Chloroflexota bacterium]